MEKEVWLNGFIPLIHGSVTCVLPRKNNGDVRIYLDAHEINKAIIHDVFLIPTLDSWIDDISEANVFSKIDLQQAYA